MIEKERFVGQIIIDRQTDRHRQACTRDEWMDGYTSH